MDDADAAQPYAPEAVPAKEVIGAGDFFAVDLRVGRVTAVEPFPEARRPAYKLTVDFGPVYGVRRSSAQIASYAQEELVGRLVVAAVNLGRKRIAGFVSEFLVLGAYAPDGTVLLLRPDGDPPLGAPVG